MAIFLPPPVLVEVTALDAVYQAAEAWLRAQGPQVEASPEAVARLSPITETHWKSRLFTVEPEPGFAFSFWAWTDPMRGKPLAVQGDLSAEGMKFGIVVARWNAVITERLLDARWTPCCARAQSGKTLKWFAFPAHGRYRPPRARWPIWARWTPS
jgi:hypothetical protein